MTISVRATSTGPNNLSTSTTINLPTGTTTNDLTVILGGHSGGNAVTVPSGWTAVCNANGMFAIYRVYQGGDPSSLTISASGGSDWWETVAASFIGVDTTTPIDTSNSFFLNMGIGPQGTWRAPSVAPNFNNSLLLACFVDGTSLGGSITGPGGSYSTVIGNGGGPSVLITSQQLSSAAQTGDCTGSIGHTNQPKMGVQIALHASGDSSATPASPIITWGGLTTAQNSSTGFTVGLSTIGPLQNDLVCVCVASQGTASISGYTTQGGGNDVYLFTHPFTTGDPDPTVSLGTAGFYIFGAFLLRSTNGALATIDQTNTQGGSGSPSSATLSTLTPATASEYLVAFWGDSDTVSGTFTPDGSLTTQAQIDNNPSILIMDTQPASNPTGTFTSTNSGTHAQIYAIELLVQPGVSNIDDSADVSGVAGTGAAGTPTTSADATGIDTGVAGTSGIGAFATEVDATASGVAGNGNAGTMAAGSTGITSGALVREVLETGTGSVYSGGVVREVLATLPAHVLVSSVVKEVLASTISKLVAGGVIREVLRSGTDIPVFAGVAGTGLVGTVLTPSSPPITGVFARGHAGIPALINPSVFGSGQVGTVALSVSAADIGVGSTGLAGVTGLVIVGVNATGQAGTPTLAVTVAILGAAVPGHAGTALGVPIQATSVTGVSSGAGAAGTVLVSIIQTHRLTGIAGTGSAGITRAVTTQLMMDALLVFETPSPTLFINPPLPSRPGGFDLREPYANSKPEERVPCAADDALHMIVTAQPEIGGPPQIVKNFIVNTASSSVTLYFGLIAQSATAVLVYRDGARTLLTTDYTVDYFHQTVTVTVTPNVQHSITIHAFGFGGVSLITDESFVSYASNPVTIDAATVTSDVTVVVNGTLLATGYTVSGNQVTLTSPPSVGGDVAVVTFSGGASTATQISVQLLTYNGGQTWNLNPHDTDTTPEQSGTIVEVNGLRLTPGIDYTVSAGLLTISKSLSSGNTILATLFSNAASMGIQTLVSTTSPITIPLPYNINYAMVWMNGLLLVPETDYTIVPNPLPSSLYAVGQYGSGLYSQGPPQATAVLTINPSIVGHVVAMIFTTPPAMGFMQWMTNTRLPATVRMPPARDITGAQLVGTPTNGDLLPTLLYQALNEYVLMSPFNAGTLAAALNPDDVTITITLFVGTLSSKLLPADPLTIPATKPGSIWIGSERIEYFGLSRSSNTITLAQLRRGTRGTSIEEQRSVTQVTATGASQTVVLTGLGAVTVTVNGDYLDFTSVGISGNTHVTFTAPVGELVILGITTGYTYPIGMAVYNGDTVFSPPPH